MKTLLTILVVSNLAILWFFVLKDNVHITFGNDNKNNFVPVNTKLPDETLCINKTLSESEKDETIESNDASSEENADEPIVIRLSDLRVKVKEMVHEEYMELLSEKDTIVEPTKEEMADTPTLDKESMDKAFSDDVRTDSVAEGQPVVSSTPEDDDESVPSFGQLDESMRTIANPKSSPSQRDKAVEAAMTITDTNIVVTLPEPLHSRFRDAVVEYQAKQIEKESDVPEYKVTKIITQPRQALPDSPENFNLRDYKRH